MREEHCSVPPQRTGTRTIRKDKNKSTDLKCDAACRLVFSSSLHTRTNCINQRDKALKEKRVQVHRDALLNTHGHIITHPSVEKKTTPEILQILQIDGLLESLFSVKGKRRKGAGFPNASFAIGQKASFLCWFSSPEFPLPLKRNRTSCIKTYAPSPTSIFQSDKRNSFISKQTKPQQLVS